ncbi:MAG TPA: glycosyltransferase [Thermoanaerobaculia bacterium]|nr:glycosyltransferase [Thermoanaerobaculia bacterium]
MPPTVSVLVSAYLSHETIGAFLECLRRQTWRDFETVVVDSSPDERTTRVVEAFPEVKLVRSETRLRPHHARNLGIQSCRGELLVCFDPDVYPQPECIERLVAAHRASGQPISGAIDSWGRGWLETGIHLTKFSKWLPGQPAGPVDVGPTCNFLVSRRMFDQVGGFDSGHVMLADAWFSWELARHGWEVRLEPGAVVAHHHLSDARSFLAERYGRGTMYATMRLDWEKRDRGRSLLLFGVSILPIRLPRILVLVARHAARAGRSRDFWRTLPLVALGHQASLLGEARGYARSLFKS